MTGYKIVNLKLLLDETSEETAKSILSSFSCPLNEDVEEFLRFNAIEFSRQGLAQTHLVFASYKGEPVLAGYFTLANKYISVSAKSTVLSSTMKKRIKRFASFDLGTHAYHLSAPLIGQLGKNYSGEAGKLMTGDELLYMACEKVSAIQLDLGGKFVYLECEDKPALLDFYDRNGFVAFDRRPLDKDETGMTGEYLVQLLKFLR